MIKTKLGFLAAGLVFLSLTATKAFAGGWPIYIWSWGNADAWKSDYKMTYLRAHLAPDVPCKGTTVTFKYENAQPGDNVTAGGENGSFTFTENGFKVSKYNSQTIPDCNTYAKFYSTNNAQKYAIVEFKTADGKTYSAKFALNFQLPNPGNTDSNEKYPLPWEENYIKGKVSDEGKEKVKVANTINIRKSGEKEERVEKEASSPMRIKIKEEKEGSGSAEMQKRIDDLQRKLEESQKKQSALEQQLNSIISWLKSVFPFFK